MEFYQGSISEQRVDAAKTTSLGPDTYPVWQTRQKDAILRDKDARKALLPKPEDPEGQDEWRMAQMLAVSIVRGSIPNAYVSLFVNCTTVDQVFAEASKIYEPKSDQREFELESALYSEAMKWTRNDHATVYIGRFTAIFNELASRIDQPESAAGKRALQKLDSKVAHAILNGLPAEWQWVGQLMSASNGLSGTLNISMVKNVLYREHRLQQRHGWDNGATVDRMEAVQYGFGSGHTQPVLGAIQATGPLRNEILPAHMRHQQSQEVDHLFKQFKDWMLEQGENGGNQLLTNGTQRGTKKDKSRIQCFSCKKFGHYSTECPETGRSSGRGHVVRLQG